MRILSWTAVTDARGEEKQSIGIVHIESLRNTDLLGNLSLEKLVGTYINTSHYVFCDISSRQILREAMRENFIEGSCFQNLFCACLRKNSPDFRLLSPNTNAAKTFW